MSFHLSPLHHFRRHGTAGFYDASSVACRAACSILPRTVPNACASAGVLGQLGYTDVVVYGGGKQDWSEAGLAVEREAVVA